MRTLVAAIALPLAASGASDLSRYRMQPMGWVFMLGSISMVLALVVFCYWRLLRKPKASRRMHAPLDIDTHDQAS